MTRASQKDFRMEAYADIPAGILIYNPSAAIIAANPSACSFLRCSEEALLGKPLALQDRQLIGQDGRPIARDDQPVYRALREKIPQACRVMGITGHSPNTVEWAIVSAAPVLGPAGEIDHVMVSFMVLAAIHDSVPDRNMTEVALQNLLEFNREIISGAGEGIIVYDRDFNCLVWNKFMEEVTGRSYSSVVGKNAFEIFPHLQEQGIDAILKDALAGKTITSPDFYFYQPASGKKNWFRATYAPHRDAFGAIIGVIGMLHDITGQMQTEADLREIETRFRALMDSSFDLIFLHDLDSSTISKGILSRRTRLAAKFPAIGRRKSPRSPSKPP
jgi:PAS domain S-box-containing protein